MGKGKPPKLLSRVIRTVAELRESKGSTVSHIVEQIRKDLANLGKHSRNVTLEIRRALKYAVEIGALCLKSRKYLMAGRKRLIPVDSLELALDYHKRKARQRKYNFRVKQRYRTRKYQKLVKRAKAHRDSYQPGRKHCYRRKKCRKHKHSKVIAVGHQQQEDPKRRPQQQQPPIAPPDSETEGDDKKLTSIIIRGPKDKNKHLDKKKTKPENERHQTSYPEYNDTMNGDDRRGIENVPGKPRRRKPILPVGRNTRMDFDNASEIDEVLNDPANGTTIAMTILLLLTLWYGYRY